MTIPHEKPVSAATSSELEGIKSVEDDERAMDANGCGCFQSLSWLRLRGKSGGSYVVLLERQKSSRENCLAKIGKKLKKMKCRVMEDGMRKKKRVVEFRYDMQSYALNFDDGIGREVDGARVCFSTRFCRINEGLDHQRVEGG